MLRAGHDEDFSPDFLAMKEVAEAKESRAKRGMYQTFMIEVKYRADLAQYLSMQQQERTHPIALTAGVRPE